MISLSTLAISALIAVESPAATSTDWVNYLLNGGPFAVVLLLIVLDKIGTHGERDRLRTENAALRERDKTLNDEIRKEVITPLADQNRLMVDIIEILDDEDRFPRGRRASRRQS